MTVCSSVAVWLGEDPQGVEGLVDRGGEGAAREVVLGLVRALGQAGKLVRGLDAGGGGGQEGIAADVLLVDLAAGSDVLVTGGADRFVDDDSRGHAVSLDLADGIHDRLVMRVVPQLGELRFGSLVDPAHGTPPVQPLQILLSGGRSRG